MASSNLNACLHALICGSATGCRFDAKEKQCATSSTERQDIILEQCYLSCLLYFLIIYGKSYRPKNSEAQTTLPYIHCMCPGHDICNGSSGVNALLACAASCEMGFSHTKNSIPFPAGQTRFLFPLLYRLQHMWRHDTIRVQQRLLVFSHVSMYFVFK